MFDASFPAPTTWQVFVQWHHTGNSGSPPVEFSIENNEIQLGTNTNGETIVWRTPLVRSVWHDFVFHVKWSPNGSVGFVELWYDGQLVLPKRYIATSYAGMTTYLKMGLYRNDTISPDGIVYHDNFIMGTTQADVTPAYAGGGTTTTPPTDGGTTTSGGTTSGGTTSGGTTDDGQHERRHHAGADDERLDDHERHGEDPHQPHLVVEHPDGPGVGLRRPGRDRRNADRAPRGGGEALRPEVAV